MLCNGKICEHATDTVTTFITTPHRWVSQRGQMPTCPRYQIQAADRLLGFMVFRNLDEGSIYL